MIVYVIICLIIAAISNALMDISSENNFNRKWLNKKFSANNKNQYIIYVWKLPKKLQTNLVKQLLRTSLVFLTDGWHLFQFIFHSSWQLAVSLFFCDWWLWFVVIKLSFSVLFEIVYSSIKKAVK